MALGRLSFQARTPGISVEELPSGLSLRGEVEWIASGPAAEIAALAVAVGSSHRLPVADGVLLLRFGNSVGRFVIGDLGHLIVRCGKWGEDTFDALLSELTEVALALPYAADQSASLPHDRSLVGSGAILMHAFVYVRQLLLDSKGSGFAAAMGCILADPHRHFRTERARVELAKARRVDARSIVRLATGAEPLRPAMGSSRGLPLAEALLGHLPILVDVPRSISSVDTPENRFVRSFLDQLEEIVQRVKRLAEARSAGASFWSSVIVDCVLMLRALEPIRRQVLWESVGRLSHMPVSSTVLQRRRGYRDVFRYQLFLGAASRLPVDETLASLLGMKDVAALYELWCFFAVVRAMEGVLGRPPSLAERPRVDDVQMDLRWGLRVAWGDDVTVYYNLTFSQTGRDAQRSISLQLRPDIVVRVRAGGCETMHVLDAKLRVERASGEEGDGPSFKWSDIGKMHTYRDAIPAVRTAFVLYPGEGAAEFGFSDSELGGVGAIPLVPGATQGQLVDHLRRLVLLP